MAATRKNQPKRTLIYILAAEIVSASRFYLRREVIEGTPAAPPIIQIWLPFSPHHKPMSILQGAVSDIAGAARRFGEPAEELQQIAKRIDLQAIEFFDGDSPEVKYTLTLEAGAQRSVTV